jgi:hypothetical protein
MGAQPPGGLLVAGAAPPKGAELELRWRNASRNLAGSRTTARSGTDGGAIAFPSDAPGAWYAFLPPAPPGEPYRVAVSSGVSSPVSCTPRDGARRTLCAPLAAIEPQTAAGFGPPGSLIVSGFLPQGVPGTPVFLHWRNATRGSRWVTEEAAPSPDESGTWFNAIRDVRPGERYEVLVTSPTTATGTCLYAGRAARTECR